jgi:preprotein translocase subunit SecD
MVDPSDQRRCEERIRIMKKYLVLAVVATLFVGCTDSPPTGSRLPVEFTVGESEPSQGLNQMTVRNSDRQVYLHDQAVLTNTHIAAAKVKNSSFGPYIEIAFTKQGRDVFARVTRENINKMLAIVVNGEVISAPIIREEITGGTAMLSGNFTKEEADRIARGIMGR